MFNVLADAGQRLDPVWACEGVRREGEMDTLEESASDQVAASRVGKAHGAYVGFAEVKEEEFPDIALSPEAVEGVRFRSHCFVSF